ncbi:MAG: PKD domain-containing protein [Acidobacteriota bacterium]
MRFSFVLDLVVVTLIWTACAGGSSATSSSTPPTAGTLSASFTLAPASPTVSQVVQFTDTSTGSPTAWSWNFGDGATSTLQHPTHVYAASGSVTVTLVATNARGSGTAISAVTVGASQSKTALGIVLGRPTDNSVTASVRADAGMEVVLEFGTASGAYTSQSQSAVGISSGPVVVLLSGLQADTQYYYRPRYRAQTDTTSRVDPERTFHTKRPSGASFTFVIQADPHMDGNSSSAVYSQTLLNALADRPDFMIDLGDTSMAEKCSIDGTNLCAAAGPATPASVSARYSMMRSYFDAACHSIPLFMVLGNHDGEAGWVGDPGANTLDTWAVTARKLLFVNPEPDVFYSGNSVASAGIGLRQNYYAFEWGSVLIVVLDPYTYTTPKPGTNGWGWTLGATQYQWLARTLAGSRARFKLVFSHHLLGGNGTDARGGAAFAQFFEWGGRNLDGTWGFDKQRPGWSAPIHQLFVDNKVTAWFHGHDHLYAQEQVDGIVYQEVPQPSLARYDTADPGAGYGYLGTVGSNIFPSSGHLRLSVTASDIRVEYVRSVAPSDETATRKNGTVIASYTIR